MYTNAFMPGQKGYVEKLNDRERTLFDNVEFDLESYHYVKSQRYVDEMRAQGAKVFLDSGAFSAWTLGTKLDLPGYCEYIKRNADILRVEDNSIMASVLDAVGDPLGTYRNQLEMEARGVRPLPCFHKGEDPKYLEYYMQHYEYITIGGMVGSGAMQLTHWLDRIWGKYLVDGAGKPKIKVHGFGLTSVPLMQQYPWTSCDSSSWIQYAVYGHVFDPKHGVVTVSGKSPRKHDAGRHLSTLTPVEKSYLNQRLVDNGFEQERLATVYEARAAFNKWSFDRIAEDLNAMHSTTFKAPKQELF